MISSAPLPLASQRIAQKMRRYRRYARPILRYGTPKKVANILLAEAELRSRRTTLTSRPYYYIIDICNLCNLRCPLCPTGNLKISRKQGMMDLDEYTSIFDRIKEFALIVSIYNHGEPFLNPDIFSIVEYNKRHRVGTNASSNLNWPSWVDLKDVVRCGLDYLTVSLDGVSQEAYETYRVRGDVSEVFENLRGLVATKKALGSDTPVIEWQYVVFKHNEGEIAQARELAEEIGVDLLRFISPGIPPEDMHDRDLQTRWMPDNPMYWERNPALVEDRGYLFDTACHYLYRSMFIYPGGGVTPCCFAHDTRHDFGSIFEAPVHEIWNNRHYRSARMLFSRRQPKGPRLAVLCDNCAIYRQDGRAGCGLKPAREAFLALRDQPGASKTPPPRRVVGAGRP